MIRTKRLKRHKMIRKTVAGSTQRPRLSVYRGNRNLYVQIIDDSSGKTLYGVSSKVQESKLVGQERAKKVAELVAEFSKKNNITSFVFDRGGFTYHGQVKTIADSLRSAGFKI
jgi:large subunit ribosomal protein L18